MQYRGSTAWATRAKNNGLSRGILALSVPDGRSNLYVCGSKASPVLKARLSARHSAPRRRPCDAEGRCGRPQCASRPRSGGQSPSLALLECVSKEQADVRAEALREVVRLVKGRPRLASARSTYTTTWADYSPPFSRLGGTEAITRVAGCSLLHCARAEADSRSPSYQNHCTNTDNSAPRSALVLSRLLRWVVYVCAAILRLEQLLTAFKGDPSVFGRAQK